MKSRNALVAGKRLPLKSVPIYPPSTPMCAFVIALIVLLASFYGMLFTPLGESARGMLASFIILVAQHYFYRAAIKGGGK